MGEGGAALLVYEECVHPEVEKFPTSRWQVARPEILRLVRRNTCRAGGGNLVR